MGRSLQEVLECGTLSALRHGEAVAHGLPPEAYTSGDFFALENDRLFRNSCVFAAFAHDLAKPGDATPVTVAAVRSSSCATGRANSKPSTMYAVIAACSWWTSCAMSVTCCDAPIIPGPTLSTAS